MLKLGVVFENLLYFKALIILLPVVVLEVIVYFVRLSFVLRSNHTSILIICYSTRLRHKTEFMFLIAFLSIFENFATKITSNEMQRVIMVLSY